MTNIAKANRGIRKSAGDRVLVTCCYLFMIIFTVFVIVPFMLVISSSFTDEITLNKFGYRLWPKKFSLDAYRMATNDGQMLRSYLITIITTVIGTLSSMLVTCMGAYALSVKTFRSRGSISMYLYFTMLFSGGLVPFYLLITKFLHLQNTIWVLLIPSLCNAWNILLMRNFFNGISDTLREAAKVDGASEIRTMMQIILPVSLPGIATISLFYALGYWNEWYRCLLFIDNSHANLFTLQYLIQRIMIRVNQMKKLNPQLQAQLGTQPAYSYRMATVILTIGPIVLLYPFLQKYFVSGLTIGAVKG